MFRILAFDRNLATRSPEKKLTLAVVYKAGSSDSEERKQEVVSALKTLASKASISGHAVQVVAVPYSSAVKLEGELVREAVGVVFVAPGLEDAVGEISAVTRKRGILSFCEAERAVRSGLGIAIIRRDAKAVAVVNLAAARAEGADPDSAFLKLAEVLR